MNLSSLVKRTSAFIFRITLRFFYLSFSTVMGCFLSCFRVRDDRHLPTSQLVSNLPHSKSRDVLISQDSLSSLFLFEGKEDSPRKQNSHLGLGSYRDDKDLTDEAEFLKACGTIAGTPTEIRKASKKLELSPSCGKDSKPRFHSWLPNIPVEELHLDVQHFDPPTPKKICEERGNAMDSLERTPSSCTSNAEVTQCDSVDSTERSRTGSLGSQPQKNECDSVDSTAVRTCDDPSKNNETSASPWLSATEIQRRNKSVHFECDTDMDVSSCGSLFKYSERHLKKNESNNNRSAYKSLPYPTPLKLSDEMQTPGTAYPATLEDLPNGKPRVRSQFVYSVYNPSENISQCNMLKGESFNSDQGSGEPGDSLEQPSHATPTTENCLKKMSHENESKLEVSLSSWLKPVSVIQEERNIWVETAYNHIPWPRRTPMDRPIIGMVAAHWNEEENPLIPPPKWQNDNGIPNSTTKYKEDQKVCWHATPFEKRLEKALSEDIFVTQRKPVCGKQIAFDEREETDTALPQQQSKTHQQPVVSL